MTHGARSSPHGAGTIDVVVIGAGHAGLAMSQCLTERSIEHVVLERGDIGNSWRRERWDSLRLLTPNWQSRLPGYEYVRVAPAADPDGFMTMPEVIDFIAAYAAFACAPVQTGTTVTCVSRTGTGYRVVTDRGEWQCRAVVIATGACNVPVLPAVSNKVPSWITMTSPMRYRHPGDLDDGGVLVVGASATGVQLADEIHRSGRPVTLAVGEHVRMPRLYRGRDVQWWMDAAGVLDERYDEVDDIVRARGVPSPQLAGTHARATLDLNALSAAGVRLVGRFVGVSGGRAQFSGSLRNHCALADLKLGRLLDRFDRWAVETGRAQSTLRGERFPPTRIERSPPLQLDLRGGEIRTIIWATGYRADYQWLQVPVVDPRGRLRHDGGVVTDAPGLYAMGLTFMRRRKSSFIHGAQDDARDLSAQIADDLGRAPVRTALSIAR